MFGRTEILLKWLLYAAGILLCGLFHGFVLQFTEIFGVMPFLFPMIAAVIAMLEGSFSGTVCGLVLGVGCDLLFAVPIPCFYTLLFPLISLAAAIIERSWLPGSLLCAAAVSAMAVLATDLFHCLLVLLQGRGGLGAALWLTFRELLVTVPFCVPVYFLFRYIYRICHVYD